MAHGAIELKGRGAPGTVPPAGGQRIVGPGRPRAGREAEARELRDRVETPGWVGGGWGPGAPRRTAGLDRSAGVGARGDLPYRRWDIVGDLEQLLLRTVERSDRNRLYGGVGYGVSERFRVQGG